MNDTHLVWFRNDLRTIDHAPLMHALGAANRDGGRLILVHVVDPDGFGETDSFGFERVGVFRRRFQLESIQDLARRIAKMDGYLHVVLGDPAESLSDLCNRNNVTTCYFYEEFGTEEKATQRRVMRTLKKQGVRTHVSTPANLYEIDDLPFSVAETPPVFSKFRRIVEKKCEAATADVSPDSLSHCLNAEAIVGDAVDLEIAPPFCDLPVRFDPRAVMRFEGGESAALHRIDDYFFQQDALREYKQTRNGMLGANYSSKLSPWLANGCVSARYVADRVRAYESQRVSNESTYWLIFELLWRDYFRLIVGKHGHDVFRVGGLRRERLPWDTDAERFAAWRDGTTGFPLIDANMRELSATGFMSNRGRQNVGSFLTKNLGLDWRMGAEWFESLLIDYDPCSNYGNWNYVAGIGNDARGFRWFNTLKQSEYYDAQGDYVRHWLPRLKDVP
ncbi:MAG: DASH family cryptochrome, partial [Planctomycetota bacterium]